MHAMTWEQLKKCKIRKIKFGKGFQMLKMIPYKKDNPDMFSFSDSKNNNKHILRVYCGSR